MTSEELANEIMAAVVAVQDRILSVGRAQYEEGANQQFERQSLQEIVQYALEEVEDGIAYNVMLRYKLTRLKAALDLAFPGTTALAPPAPAAPTTGAHSYRPTGP
ncbi:hypothetical protein [Streptosporangium sp. NPDC002524]|uniref:hypothetical protein n=1 Tax=Streptosporangium sp. NPDC002524 TaxID=3154537 RepID=UPI00333338EF